MPQGVKPNAADHRFGVFTADDPNVIQIAPIRWYARL
jgi:hypothetical protein